MCGYIFNSFYDKFLFVVFLGYFFKSYFFYIFGLYEVCLSNKKVERIEKFREIFGKFLEKLWKICFEGLVNFEFVFIFEEKFIKWIRKI